MIVTLWVIRVPPPVGSRVCARAVTSGGQVDHFIPWARHFDNGLDNLVYAHASCNNRKRALLVAENQVEHWVERFDGKSRQANGLVIAAAKEWERDPVRTLGLARASYLKLPATARLWVGKGTDPSQVDGPRLKKLLTG